MSEQPIAVTSPEIIEVPTTIKQNPMPDILAKQYHTVSQKKKKARKMARASRKINRRT